MQQQHLKALLDKRFLFVVGKGGVGKTTVAASLAAHAVKQGKRVLVALCNAKDRFSPMLGGDGKLGPDIREIETNLFAVNMTPTEALAEYGRMLLRSEMLYSALFDNRLIQGVLRGTPGIETWSMLGKAYYHAVRDKLDDGSPRFDLVILDAPATGHALEMLRVPRVLTSVAPGGVLLREAEAAIAMLEDPSQAGFVLVTLPEDLPVTETMELAATLRAEFQAPLAHLCVNKSLSYETGLNAEDVAWLNSPAAHTQANLDPVHAHLQRLARQKECIETLSALNIPTTLLLQQDKLDVRALLTL